MKTYILPLLLVLAASAAWSETTCYTVEHPDYNEAVCIGDEKSAPAKPAGTEVPVKAAETVPEQFRPQKPSQAAAAGRAAAGAQPPNSPPSRASAAPAGSAPKETAAEHLARRRAIALQNRAKITGAADTAIP